MLTQCGKRMADIIRLNQHAVVGQASEFGQDPFGISRRFWFSGLGVLPAARITPHAEFFFDQLEVPVVMPE